MTATRKRPGRKFGAIGLAGLAVAAVGGCATTAPTPTIARARYEIVLQSVERSPNASRYGAPVLKRDTEAAGQHVFEDGLVKILWRPNHQALFFTLTNKTEQSLKIVWDAAAYVDIKGTTHRVMHNGVKFTDRNSAQPPTVVIRRGTFEDAVRPTTYTVLLGNRWLELPLFPSFWKPQGSENAVDRLRGITAPYVGKTVQLMLPFESGGALSEYIFMFKIENVEVSPPPVSA